MSFALLLTQRGNKALNPCKVGCTSTRSLLHLLWNRFKAARSNSLSPPVQELENKPPLTPVTLPYIQVCGPLEVKVVFIHD